MAETNNHLEILVGVQADTAGSKQNIDKQLESLSKELSGLDVKINIDKDSQRTLDNLSKLDLSKLKAQVDDINKSLSDVGKGLGDGIGKEADKIKKHTSEVARSTQKEYDKVWKEMEQLAGNSFRDINKKGLTTIEEIEREFNKIDSKINVEFDLKNSSEEGIREIQKFKAQVERDGKLSTIEFKPALINDGTKDTKVWMPEVLKEVNSSAMQASQAMDRFDSALQKARNSGRVTKEEFDKLNKELEESRRNIESQSFGANQESVRKLNSQLDETIRKRKQETEEFKEQERLKNRLVDLEAKMISLGKSRPKAEGLEEYRSINTEIEKMHKGTTLHQGSINDLTNRYKILNAETKEVGRSHLGIIDSFKVAMEKFPIWMAASTLFYGAVRTATEFSRIIVDIDTKMTELQRVMREGEDLGAVFDRATESAERFGQTLSATLDSYAEFARQGFSGSELGFLADAALITSNVAEMTAKDASEFMTATLLQWNMEAQDSMKIVDAWNETANTHAVTVQSLAQGQSRAAATAKAMGVDFEELNAIIGAVSASTRQSGNEVGKQNCPYVQRCA